MKTIKFARNTFFTGRNGMFKASGLEILPLDHNNSFMISPITSKGLIGRCDVEIPKEVLPELIKTLQSLIKVT